jgi:hypothetical protein
MWLVKAATRPDRRPLLPTPGNDLLLHEQPVIVEVDPAQREREQEQAIAAMSASMTSAPLRATSGTHSVKPIRR